MLYIGNGQLVQYLLMVAVSFALGFALTYMFGYEDEKEVATEVATERLVQEETTGNIPASLQNETLVTPIVGDVVALADVNVPCFFKWSYGTRYRCKPVKVWYMHQLMLKFQLPFQQDTLLA